ncbi:MAG: hypothetical protein HFI70_04975 [Lachnospiraceae bacterium]|nr:hypothetical protein [Lachnospiraceae bacterium]
MKKIMIAVCDTDTAYGERLGEWISLENEDKFSGVFYSAWEYFKESLSSQIPDIVLLSKDFLEYPQMREMLLRQRDTDEQDIQNAEEKPFWLYLKGEEQAPSCARDLPAVQKYQSASQIVREIFSYYQSWGKGRQSETVAEKEIIGIYSPGHSIWQTPFALTFAQALGQKEKVLYVNLQECAGFSGWFEEEYEKDLLDVMYLCLTNEVNVSDCVNSALYTMEGIHYIPPAEDSGCLGEISSQDYLAFVKLLAAKSGYDVILLDFGMMIPGFYRILGTCSKVYIATEPGEMHQAPLLQFKQITARQEDIQLENKLVYLSLPAVHQNIYQGSAKIQQWLWGTMGDFSRRLAGVQSGTD